MKRARPLSLTIALLLSICLVVVAQTVPRDVVYLKNGSVIKGIVLEQIPDSTVKVQTSDGSIFVFKMNEVERIVKETMPTSPQPQDQVIAQPQRLSGILISGGIVIPNGQFAASSGDLAGYAKLGFVVGIEYSSISEYSIYSAPSIIFVSNPMDESEVRKDLGVSSSVSGSISSWTAVIPSIALGFGMPTGDTRAFIAGIIGIAFCSSPDMEFSSGGSTVTQKSASANAVAYGATLGIKTSRGFNLSVRYLSTTPKYKVTATGGGESFSGEFEQPTNSIQVIVGLAL